MAKIKCIIRQEWETRNASGELLDRHNRVYVTNEDGTPHVYASIREARAEIIGNYGRDANRSGILHNRSVDDYSGNVHSGYVFIVREDTQEYAEAIETAEAEQRAEIIAAIEDPEERTYIEAAATANRWSPEETADAISYRAALRTANAAAAALVNAYAEAIGDAVTEDDPEAFAARMVARDDLTGTSYRATDEDRETVDTMVEAIAERWTQDHQPRDLFAELAEYEAEAAAMAAIWHTRPAADLTQYEACRYLEIGPAPAPTYQRHELEAYLGEPDDYDVGAIEAEATEYDPKTSRTVWRKGIDLAAIAERHELYSYAPAI